MFAAAKVTFDRIDVSLYYKSKRSWIDMADVYEENKTKARK